MICPRKYLICPSYHDAQHQQTQQLWVSKHCIGNPVSIPLVIRFPFMCTPYWTWSSLTGYSIDEPFPPPLQVWYLTLRLQKYFECEELFTKSSQTTEEDLKGWKHCTDHLWNIGKLSDFWVFIQTLVLEGHTQPSYHPSHHMYNITSSYLEQKQNINFWVVLQPVAIQAKLTDMTLAVEGEHFWKGSIHFSGHWIPYYFKRFLQYYIKALYKSVCTIWAEMNLEKNCGKFCQAQLSPIPGCDEQHYNHCQTVQP